MSKKLVTEPIPKLLFELALPASTGIIFNTLYNVVDTLYAGLISTYAVAALSMSFFLYFMIIGVGFGFGSAITALVGNSLGKKRQYLASIFAHKGIVFNFLLGILTATLGAIFAKDLLLLAGAKEEYLPLALEYINTILISSPLFMGTYAFNAILVATGDTKSYRNMLIFGFFLNLGLNPLFIYTFNMGLSGIAAATVSIQVISIFYLGHRVYIKKMVCFNDIRLFLPDLRIYKQIFVQGLPSSLNMLTMSLGSIIAIYFVSTYGYKAVAGYGIAFRVEQIMLLPAIGISSAVLSLVSNNYGARKMERVKETLILALKYGAFISCLGIIFGFTLGEWIITQFDKDIEVINYATEYLHVEVFVFFGYVLLFITASTLQGIKKPGIIFYVGLYRQIIAKLVIFSAAVFWLNLPIIYLWYGLFFIVYSAGIFMIFYTKQALHVKM